MGGQPPGHGEDGAIKAPSSRIPDGIVRVIGGFPILFSDIRNGLL